MVEGETESAGKAESVAGLPTRWLVGTAALLAVGAVVAWSLFLRGPRESSRAERPKLPERLQRPAAAKEGFVGSAACQECHAAIAEKYASHPMGQSLASIASASPLEDYRDQVKFAPTPRREYWVERRGEETLHHEIGKDAQGETLFDQALPMEFVIGSGQRGRSYVLRRDGLLFMSPISWYSAKNRWDLSPQYAPESHRRFERPASDRCLQCHVGRLNYAETPTTEIGLRYGEPPFHELSIGCERCHGPGQAHIEYRRQRKGASPPSQSADPIVNPSRLEPTRRDAVCNQCHLQGDAQILRYGRVHGDFRPGDRLGDIWTIFVQGTGVDSPRETRAVSQVEQMEASRCYQASERKLGCVSCHDPHAVPPSDTKAKYYESKCANCHSQQGCKLPLAERQRDPERQHCIQCHMPRLDAADVPHTTQTDHRLLRDPSRPSAEGGSDKAHGEARIFDLPDTPLTPIEQDRAWGIWISKMAEVSRLAEDVAEAQRRLLPAREAAPDDIDVLDALAVTYAIQGNNAEAVALWRSALAIEPKRQNVLLTLALLLHQGGDYRQAAAYFSQLLRTNPHQAEVHLRYSRTLRALGKMEEAIQAAERSRTLDPTKLETYSWLKELYQLQGVDAKAAEMEGILKKLRPDEVQQGQG